MSCCRKNSRPSLFVAILWVVLWLAIGVMALVSRQAHSETTMKIGVFVDSVDISKEHAYDLIREAESIYHRNGLSINFSLDSFEVVKPSAHSNPWHVLDDVVEQRISPTRTADVYILLTKRTLSVGSSIYAGVATKGPACSVSASAVVSLWGAGDAVTLAHELAHTLGVEHDQPSGYLMSVKSNVMSDVMSPDTIGVIKGAYLDCMQEPAATVPTGTTHSTASVGGGGSLQLWFLLAMACLVVLFRK
jgi:hypothetical protein